MDRHYGFDVQLFQIALPGRMETDLVALPTIGNWLLLVTRRAQAFAVKPSGTANRYLSAWRKREIAAIGANGGNHSRLQLPSSGMKFDRLPIILPVFHKDQTRRASYFLLLWIALGLFFGTKRIIETHVYGYSYPWDRALWWQLFEWSLWGLLSLGIFAACRACDRHGANWRKQSLTHALLGSAVALAQGFLAALGSHVEAWLRGWPEMQNGEPWSFVEIEKVTVVNHFHQNLLIYVAIVAAWHAVRHYQRARERGLRATSAFIACRPPFAPHLHTAASVLVHPS